MNYSDRVYKKTRVQSCTDSSWLLKPWYHLFTYFLVCWIGEHPTSWGLLLTEWFGFIVRIRSKSFITRLDDIEIVLWTRLNAFVVKAIIDVWWTEVFAVSARRERRQHCDKVRHFSQGRRELHLSTATDASTCKLECGCTRLTRLVKGTNKPCRWLLWAKRICHARCRAVVNSW